MAEFLCCKPWCVHAQGSPTPAQTEAPKATAAEGLTGWAAVTARLRCMRDELRATSTRLAAAEQVRGSGLYRLLL